MDLLPSRTLHVLKGSSSEVWTGDEVAQVVCGDTMLT